MDPVRAEIDPIDVVTIDDRTVSRYKKNYSIPSDAVVTTDMVRHHWTLERSLTKMLLASNPENRWETWENSYSRLYRECSWLNTLAAPRYGNSELAYGHFVRLIGNERTIYEVGSGEGGLIKFLAAHGYVCVATEVTRERGSRSAKDSANVEWHSCDGVHLDKFEPADHYDIVLSTQVIEHLHPADMPQHFASVLTILRPGGRYIFNTPHQFFGPADLSAVFEKPGPVCMHLKEYLYGELANLLAQAGFANVKAIYLLPSSLRKHIPFVFASKMYLGYMRFMERILSSLNRHAGLKLPNIILRLLLFSGDAFVTAQKPLRTPRN